MKVINKVVLATAAVLSIASQSVLAADLPGACKVDTDLHGAVHYNGAVANGKAIALNGDVISEFPISAQAGVIGTGAPYAPKDTPDGQEVDLVVQNGSVVCVANPEVVNLNDDAAMAALAKPDAVQ